MNEDDNEERSWMEMKVWLEREEDGEISVKNREIWKKRKKKRETF